MSIFWILDTAILIIYIANGSEFEFCEANSDEYSKNSENCSVRRNFIWERWEYGLNIEENIVEILPETDCKKIMP